LYTANKTVEACIYSGFTFSHYDLPFPARYCIPYVRSSLYQLVIRVKGFCVCALHCVRVPLRLRKWPRFRIFALELIDVGTTLWESRVVYR